MKRIYLCSPYSDPDPEVRRLRYQEVCRIAADLMMGNMDLLVFSPIAHSHGMAVHGHLPGDYNFWMKIDEQWISWADEVWVADMIGRGESKGIIMEIEYAIETGKPVVWL